MSTPKDQKMHIGVVSYALPNELEVVTDFEPYVMEAFKIYPSDPDFQIRAEVSYSREDAKTYLTAVFSDSELEPTGVLTECSVNGLSGYYLEYIMLLGRSVWREYCFDLPDEEFNFFSVAIFAACERDLREAMKSPIVKDFLQSIQIEK